MDIDINALIEAYGIEAVIALITVVIVYLIVRSGTRRADAKTEDENADIEQQRTFTRMAVDNNAQIQSNQNQIVTLYETINSLKDKIIELIEQHADEREKLVELKTKYEHSQELHKIEIGLLKDQLNRMESKSTKLENDLTGVTAERDRYRKERDELREKISDLRLQIARLEASNDAYKNQVRMADTQRIPPLEDNPEDKTTTDGKDDEPNEGKKIA